MFDTLPTAARRLGDAALVKDYLGLIHQLAARPPRGLRPMLTRLDELLAKLTLGGLRRWVLWGAQAHGRDLKALVAYFGLESADSQAVLRRERRGTLFVDTQRKLNFYLRALWGRNFYLRPTSGDFETRAAYKPYIEQRVIHVPDAFDDYAGIPGKELYRAACAHAAAHLAYTRKPLPAETLTPAQMLLIGLFEDARIEYLAIREFPGLRPLWLRIHEQVRQVSCPVDPEGIIRQRHQEDGDEIDLNAAVRALVDLRLGGSPDVRINTRYIRKTRDLAVLGLLDLSESTNETLPCSDRPILQLAREATALLAWAIDGIGDPFAIHGFASDGRHDLQYYRFKDFGQPYDDEAKARLAGMRGGLSTRMGGALRHAARFLLRQPQRRKLILLVSDGEPADIDVRDPQSLRHDTKKAVEELAGRGITSYCLTLDPNADDYISRIFGANRYTVVDHVQRLPEKLPLLFAGLTR